MYRGAHFHIDVGVEAQKQILVEGNHMAIVELALLPRERRSLAPAKKSYWWRLGSSIERKAVDIQICLSLKLLWKVGFAFAIFHAWAARIDLATWAVQHMLCHKLVESWIRHRVGNLC